MQQIPREGGMPGPLRKFSETLRERQRRSRCPAYRTRATAMGPLNRVMPATFVSGAPTMMAARPANTVTTVPTVSVPAASRPGQILYSGNYGDAELRLHRRRQLQTNFEGTLIRRSILRVEGIHNQSQSRSAGKIVRHCV